MLNLKKLKFKTPDFKTLAAVGIVVCASMVAMPPARAQSAVEKTYKAKCIACHAFDGSATAVGKKLGAHDFRSPEVQKMTDEKLIEITAKGKAKMPAYENSLKPEEIKQLVDHVRELAKPANGPSAMYRSRGYVGRESR